MSLESVLEIVKERGLSIKLDGEKPMLIGPKEEATDALLGALKIYRKEIVEGLKQQEASRPRIREWLWKYGGTYQEHPEDAKYLDPNHHPVGASQWRYVGESEWRTVPPQNHPWPGRSAEKTSTQSPPLLRERMDGL